MTRRHIKDAPYVREGSHGTPAREILQRWMRNGGKRRVNRLERREAKQSIRKDDA